MKIGFELSDKQLKVLLIAYKPPFKQVNINSAWKELGMIMGFKPKTVSLSDKGNKFFFAEPITPE